MNMVVTGDRKVEDYRAPAYVQFNQTASGIIRLLAISNGQKRGILHQITCPPAGEIEAEAESHISPPSTFSHGPSSTAPKRTRLLDLFLISSIMTYVEMSGLT